MLRKTIKNIALLDLQNFTAEAVKGNQENRELCDASYSEKCE